MKDKTCCVTGHRDIPADKAGYVRQELNREIEQAIKDGYTTYISGFAPGVDLIFAECVIEAQEQHSGLFLQAAIPYPGRLERLNAREKEILKKCSGYNIICDKYSRGCYLARNRYMVQQSSRIIAAFDGREKGGTVQTIRFAHVNKKKVRVIEI